MSELKSLRGAHCDISVCKKNFKAVSHAVTLTRLLCILLCSRLCFPWFPIRWGMRLPQIKHFKQSTHTAAGGDDSRVVDVWMLLVLHTLGGSQSKAAGALVKKRMTDGSYSRELLSKAIVGHQVCSPE